MTGTYQQT